MIIDCVQEVWRTVAEDPYKSTPVAMLRAPLLPVGFYAAAFADNHLTRERLCEIAADPAFREMLGIASPALLERVEAFQLDPSTFSAKRSDDLLGAVARYLIRATTRPTPFGAFAGIGAARYSETAKLRLDSLRPKRVIARLDYAVVLQFVHDLERDPALRPYLHLFANPALFSWGERVYLDYRDSYGQGKSADPISVKATPPLQKVLEWSQTPLSYEALLTRLCDAYPDKHGERLASFLHSLLDQGIVLSTLRPPLNDPDPLNYLCRELPSTYNTPLQSQIEELKVRLDAYNRTPLGGGLPILKNLSERARKMGATQSNHVQVDAKLSFQEAALPTSLAQEVSRAVRALLRIWPLSETSPALKLYAREFVDRYGIQEEVPLLAVLNNEIGLGPPPTYKNPPPARGWQYSLSDESKQHKEWRSQLLGEALQAGSHEILIDEAKIRHFELDPSSLPPSLDVFLSLAAHDAEAVSGGQYLAVLGATGAASPSGRALGRFAYLDSAICDQLQKVADQEEELNPDVIFADLIYTHPRGHSNNIAIHPCTYHYQVAIATTPSVPFTHHIPLSDLCVGVSAGRFYLRSRTRGKQVLMRSVNLLNPSFAPNAVRFIMDVAGGNNFNKIAWRWGGLVEMPFLPRVRFGKVVLSPARWRLPEVLSNQREETWSQELAAWRERFRVPSHVYLVDHDNRLLLDLNNPFHRKMIQRAAARGTAIVEEPLPGLDQAPVSDQNGNAYMLEAIVSLELTEPKPVVPAPVMKQMYEHPERIRLPGEDCLYLKLYGPRSLRNDLLFDLQPILADLAPGTGRWFFLRYRDPDPHLRLRIFGESSFLLKQALPKLCGALRPLYQRGLLTRAAIDSYEREAARYGGYEGVAACEEIFSRDTSALMSLFRLHREGLAGFEWEDLTLLGLEALSRGLGFGDHERRAIYHLMSLRPASDSSEDKAARKKYLSALLRRRRQAVRNQLSVDWIVAQPGGESLMSWMQEFENSLESDGNCLRNLERRGRLVRSRLEIAASLGHMHCNRAGLLPQEEHDLAFVLARVLEGQMKCAAVPIATVQQA